MDSSQKLLSEASEIHKSLWCDLLKKNKFQANLIEGIFSGKQSRWRDLFEYHSKAFLQDRTSSLLQTVPDSPARNGAGMVEKSSAALLRNSSASHNFQPLFYSYRKCFQNFKLDPVDLACYMYTSLRLKSHTLKHTRTTVYRVFSFFLLLLCIFSLYILLLLSL